MKNINFAKCPGIPPILMSSQTFWWAFC